MCKFLLLPDEKTCYFPHPTLRSHITSGSQHSANKCVLCPQIKLKSKVNSDCIGSIVKYVFPFPVSPKEDEIRWAVPGLLFSFSNKSCLHVMNTTEIFLSSTKSPPLFTASQPV